MKALLVDEEKHVSKAVRLLADWPVLGIDTLVEAEDGPQAKNMIERHKPEIIIIDMTPRIGGPDLLEWIQRQAVTSKTIVIGSPGDFELVRQTVRYGGMDFLVKPLNAAQLQASLGKAVRSWRLEELARVDEQRRSMEMNQLKPVLRDKLLSTLLNAEPFPAIKEQLYQQFPNLAAADACRIAVLSLDTMEQSVRERFVFRRDHLIYSLINICNEFLQERRCGMAFRYWNSESELILLLWDQLPKAEAMVGAISQGIEYTLRARLDFGIGLEQPFPSGLPDSYKQARSALRNRNLLEPGSRITTFTANDSSIMAPLHLTDFEEHIRMAVRSGKTDQIEEALQVFIDAVQKLDRITVEQLELWGHEYNVLKTRWAQELFKDEQTELSLPSEGATYIVPMDPQGRVSIELWQQELRESMIRLAGRLQQRQVQGSSVIFDIVKYIDANYARDLTLQELADQFFLSREYISRKFKLQFGENIVDYISQVRINKSKLLLLNPLLKIAEVAQSVGYQDEKYFSKVFKKLEGVSPNEYRKTMKLLESVESN